VEILIAEDEAAIAAPAVSSYFRNRIGPAAGAAFTG
jgi:hypothetical protein